MIEVFEQAEAVDLREVFVRLALRDAGSDLDGDLFETDGGFEWRKIGGQQPVDHGLLVLLDAPDFRERQTHFAVHHARAWRVMSGGPRIRDRSSG